MTGAVITADGTNVVIVAFVVEVDVFLTIGEGLKLIASDLGEKLKGWRLSQADPQLRSRVIGDTAELEAEI